MGQGEDFIKQRSFVLHLYQTELALSEPFIAMTLDILLANCYASIMDPLASMPPYASVTYDASLQSSDVFPSSLLCPMHHQLSVSFAHIYAIFESRQNYGSGSGRFAAIAYRPVVISHRLFGARQACLMVQGG